jgi:hypothetical protein
MVIEAFSTCEGPGEENCLNVIDSIDADPGDDSYCWYWLVLASLFVFFRLLALGVLTREANKFC